MELPRSGSAAKKLGVSKYFTGKPCHLGHVAPRYTQSGVCCECGSINSVRHRLLPAAKANTRAYYERRRVDSPETIMWTSARLRAKKTGVPFAITPEDILVVWPCDDICPVLGIEMRHNFNGKSQCHAFDSPSLDKIIPSLGYVKGNIVVISMHANRLKGDETDPEVFRKVARWLESVKGN